MSNKVEFNNKELNDYCIIKSIKESILPPITTIKKKLPGRIGTKFIKKELGERQIDILIELGEDSFADREETINNLTTVLYTDQEEKLIIRENKTYMASLDGSTDLKNLVFNGETTLKFIATNPIAVGKEITEENIHNKELKNKGTYKTRGIIQVILDGDVDHLEVKLLNTGEKVYIEDDFKNGDVIVIDLEQEYVKKNGNLIMDKVYLESDFFDIPVGKFTITISSGTGDLTYNERWL